MTQGLHLVIEGEGKSLCARVPDLPGCTAAGDSREQVLELLRGAIAMHVESSERPTSPPTEVASVTL